MIFSEVRNLQALDVDGCFDCEVNHPTFGWIPYTVTPNDDTEHGQKLHQDVVAGKFGKAVPFNPDSPVQKAIKAAEVQRQLDDLDRQSIRALRAKLSGLATKDDDAKLLDLETKAAALRTKLGALK